MLDAFVSKTLSDPETQYSNIKREMLIIVLDLERFHHHAWSQGQIFLQENSILDVKHYPTYIGKTSTKYKNRTHTHIHTYILPVKSIKPPSKIFISPVMG